MFFSAVPSVGGGDRATWEADGAAKQVGERDERGDTTGELDACMHLRPAPARHTDGMAAREGAPRRVHPAADTGCTPRSYWGFWSWSYWGA